MRKRTLEQKSYLESAGSIYAGFNSYKYLIGKLYVSEKPESFPAIIDFTNRGIVSGKVLGSKYSKEITDHFSLDFLNNIKNENELLTFYNQLAEFLDIYFNHLYLSQKNKKSFNIHFRYCLANLDYSNKDLFTINKIIDSEYIRIQYPDLKLPFQRSDTIDKWKRDIQVYKQDTVYTNDILSKVDLEPELKKEFLIIFRELTFIVRFHKTYYLNLIRALRIIYEYETLRIYSHKSQKVALDKVAKYFKCTANNIRNILEDYRIQGIKAKVKIPTSSYIHNKFESIKKKYPECFSESEIPKDFPDELFEELSQF